MKFVSLFQTLILIVLVAIVTIQGSTIKTQREVTSKCIEAIEALAKADSTHNMVLAYHGDMLVKQQETINLLATLDGKQMETLGALTETVANIVGYKGR